MNRLLSHGQGLVLMAAAVLVAALAVAGCGAAPTPTATPRPPAPTPTPMPPGAATSVATTVTDVVWQWVSLVDRTAQPAKTTTVPDPAKYTIIFRTDGTVSGKADCNSFTGTYTTTRGYSIKTTTSTTAYCGETSLDKQYIQLLNQVAAGGPDGAGGFALETAGGAQRLNFKNGGPAPKQ
jgi:heat shock protein HslJ